MGLVGRHGELTGGSLHVHVYGNNGLWGSKGMNTALDICHVRPYGNVLVVRGRQRVRGVPQSVREPVEDIRYLLLSSRASGLLGARD